MSHTIELTDEQYAILRETAEARGESPDAVVAALIAELRAAPDQPRYYETDDFLRHLGATEDEINDLNREIAEANEREAAAHADA
ncbi:MAG: hypothetical protein ACRDHP_11310 [Ktedonobacterales bacterium]